MMLNTVFAHLETLSNNIYTRKSSPTNIYPFKVNNRNIEEKCKNYSKLTVKTQKRLSALLIVNFGHNLLLFLVSCCYSEQLNVCWIPPYQFVNSEITYCCTYLQMYKNISEIISKDSYKKRLQSKVE